MTKRFDRENGKKLHMQSLGALAHISYQEPGLCGYELAAMYMKEIGTKVSGFKSFAEQVGIKEKTYNYINSVIEANMIKIN